MQVKKCVVRRWRVVGGWLDGATYVGEAAAMGGGGH